MVANFSEGGDHTAHHLAYEGGQRWASGSGPSGGMAGSAPERALTFSGELLAGCGHAPTRTATQRQLLMRNCPFQQLARRAPS
jgi:predicted ArsR family transcriptional regulator